MAAFRDFVRDELMPEIGRRYPVTDETAIIGESLAGLFVVETLLTEPALFDHYIAVDPSLWWNGGALIAQAGERLATLPAEGAALFLASADDGNGEHAAGFVAALHAHAPAQLRWTHRPMPGERHQTIFHPAALQAFRTLFAAPSP